MFVDDMGLLILTTNTCLIEVEASISLYERASSAKLSLSKSTIIPIGLPTIPRWVIDKGYDIAPSGEIRKYLGSPLGKDLSLTQIQNNA